MIAPDGNVPHTETSHSLGKILYPIASDRKGRLMRLHRYPVRWGLVGWLFVLSAIAFMDRTNVSIAGVAIGQAYQLDKIRLGWIFSAFLVGYAAFQVPAGWLATRAGPRRVLALAVLWWGVFTALTASVSPQAPRALLLLILIR